MSLANRILEELHQYGKAEVKGFGTFVIDQFHAEVDRDHAVLTPPKQKINFTDSFHPDQIEDKEAKIWLDSLDKNHTLSIEKLGIFSKNSDGITFLSEKNMSIDYYGLENVLLQNITTKPAKEYTFSRSLWWLLLILVPILGIIYFALTQPETIFGKTSFSKTELSKGTRNSSKK